MAGGSHATVRRARITYMNEDLRVAARRGVGWIGQCPNRCTFPIRSTREAARQDMRDHRCEA